MNVEGLAPLKVRDAAQWSELKAGMLSSKAVNSINLHIFHANLEGASLGRESELLLCRRPRLCKIEPFET